jgi:preprotein translocase subunit Sss1
MTMRFWKISLAVAVGIILAGLVGLLATLVLEIITYSPLRALMGM